MEHVTHGTRSWRTQRSGSRHLLLLLAAALVALLLLPGTAAAQFAASPLTAVTEPWFAQNSGIDGHLNAVDFWDTQHGCIVNEWGRILFTADGGATWTIDTTFWHNEDPDSWPGFTDVCYGDQNHIYISSTNGTITSSANGGASWVSQDLGDVVLYAVDFVDATHGWAAGHDWLTDRGLVFVTANGGLTWTAQTNGMPEGRLRDVSFADLTHGCAVGYDGAFIITSDGGAHWTSVTSSAAPDDLLCVNVADAQHACAAGNGTIITTSNGGQTWTARVTGTTYDLWGVDFPDVQHGWVVGGFGTIWATTNGGLTWKPQAVPAPIENLGVSFADATHGWVVGPLGEILATTNGGVSAKPVIKKVAPTTVRRDKTLTVTGSGFGSWTATNLLNIHVWVGTTRASRIISWTNSVVKVQVARTTKLGKQQVIVRSWGGTSNAKPVTVKK